MSAPMESAEAAAPAAEGTAEAAPAPRHQFSVVFAGGSSYEVAAQPGDTVRQLREQVEAQHPVPPASELKLCQGGQQLADGSPVEELDAAEPIAAIISRSTDVGVLLEAAGSFSGYQDILRAGEAGADVVTLGPMPNILDVLEEMGGQPAVVEHLRKAPTEDGTLMLQGPEALVLPALDLRPLFVGRDVHGFKAVTISVELNSDAYNQGLGLVAEAPLGSPIPAACDTKSCGGHPYTYNGYGLRAPERHRNVVKFHPGMGGGQLRVEGAGGWGNQSIGFTPESWTQSQSKFHILELTCTPAGENTVCLKDAGSGQDWRRPWQHLLTDGQRSPAIYAWLDLGSATGKPLYVRSINLKVEFAAK